MREYGWVWPAYGFDQWAWSEMNGWYNPEDDPASPTETALLDEIKRLRADLAAERDEVERLMDGMEWAWLIIANAQYWDMTDTVHHAEWSQARHKWRDEHWHPALDRNSRNKEARNA